MAKALSGFVIASVALSLAGHATAQSRDNYFARDRNISVRERARPGYQALGVPLGGFLAYPKIELGVQDNSNIYGSPSNAKSDAIGVIDPEIDLVSRWSRHSFAAFVKTDTREYVSTPKEDTTDWQFGGKGQIDLGDSAINFGGDYGYLAEPRTASIGANVTSFITAHPIEYYQSDANVDFVHTFNRLKVEGGVVYSSAQFQNGTNPQHGVILETPFNNSHTVVSGKAGYAVSPDTAVYGSITYNIIDYPNQTVTNTSLDRNSTGETFDVGANFDITELLRGDVQLGYLHQAFSASAFKAVDGLHVLGKVEWFPTQLTTVTLSGQRDVNPATLAGSPSYILNGVGGQVDHELLRNVILTALARYQQDDYQGISRHDRIGEFAFSGDYLVSRNVGLHLAYDYLTQASSGTNKGVNFNDNRVTLSTTLQY